MNLVALGLFLIYIGALAVSGAAIYLWNDPDRKNDLNRAVCLGEILLLGAICVIGEMLLLSVLKLYTAVFLWGVVVLNYAWLASSRVRIFLRTLLAGPVKWDAPLLGFLLFLAVFIFRNFYYHAVGDSHSTYLFAQKIWLEAKTSLWGNPALDMRVFVPHFNALPYALGISTSLLSSTFFAQLVVVSWTVIALVLIFGYTSYRFGRYFALAATLLVLLDEHIFFSGANSCCITNSALIALIFAAAYNFWEARASASPFRFLLGLIFLSQLMANKYQMFYVTFFFLGIGLFVQPHPWSSIKLLLGRRRWMVSLSAAVIFMLLWYLKNYLVTGDPVFPILAGRLGIFNWTAPMADMFNKIYAGGMSPFKFFKYMSFFYVWPGISALKMVLMGILSLPFIVLISSPKSPGDHKEIFELSYWLGLSILFMAGLCMISFVDPRHYRYGLNVFTFCVVILGRYLMMRICGTRCLWLLQAGLIVFALAHVNIIFAHGGLLKRPSFRDNLRTLTGQLSEEDAMKRYYPGTEIIKEILKQNPVKVEKAAWDTGVAGEAYIYVSPFLLPVKPQVGLWHTTLVKWDSYARPEWIVKDLQDAGIERVMHFEDQKLQFLSLEEYAALAGQYDRFPKIRAYDYGLPRELLENY